MRRARPSARRTPRGRPRIDPELRRASKLTIRLTEREHAAILRLAAAAGKHHATWIRERLLEDAP